MFYLNADYVIHSKEMKQVNFLLKNNIFPRIYIYTNNEINAIPNKYGGFYIVYDRDGDLF